MDECVDKQMNGWMDPWLDGQWDVIINTIKSENVASQSVELMDDWMNESVGWLMCD